MKIFIYILVFLFISCEESGLGVNENIGEISYYDAVAFG